MHCDTAWQSAIDITHTQRVRRELQGIKRIRQVWQKFKAQSVWKASRERRAEVWEGKDKERGGNEKGMGDAEETKEERGKRLRGHREERAKRQGSDMRRDRGETEM